MKWINRIRRYRLNLDKKRNLKNSDFSLIANNCNGAFMCHDLGLRFNSPFVNLWLPAKDYIKLLGDLEGYLSSELEFVKDETVSYPVGKLRDVTIYFQHYKTEEEARQKWAQRLSRLNMDNLFVLMTETVDCTYDELAAFAAMPFRNKAALTHKSYPEFPFAVPLSEYRDLGYVGKCYRYVSRFSGVRFYDEFDYVGWFNSGKT